MSAGLQAKGLARGYAAGQAKIRQQNADNHRGAFLRKLDDAKIELDGFELDFVASFIRERCHKYPGLDFQWFTPKRSDVVDRMIQKYDVGALSLSPIAHRLSPPEIVRAEAGTCQYLTREDGVQRECGAPAVWKGRSHPFLLYCDACGQIVGRSFEVVALQADAKGLRKTLKPFRHFQR